MKSKILDLLKNQYPSPKISLNFNNTLELLVATILSAQCTDKQVNIVTKLLFKKYKTVNDYATADLRIFEAAINSVGFYHNKAKNIINTSKKILSVFNGKIPESMDKLITLPGVARKTANIILFHGFNKIEGIAVDTHVKRISQRLGLTINTNPDKIEKDLMSLLPKKEWGILNNLIIHHGRTICTAKNQKCGECVLSKLCHFYKINKEIYLL
ncbi:MAG: endonuclease III [Candidatus Omnitrophica bacterium]|nr:endonuclease III [Candidatus Omnitrophota bacterium]MCK5289169.1 endonuclease III [Candidatus Omnitrophota bacterium]MCK5493714.1 endonuclease III [Candidatus Omnitrophota bacterium]